MEKMLIAYYTGSVSTGLVAQEVRDQLIARGVSVEMHRLTDATKEDLRSMAEACHDLILIYAVHAFNAPSLVYEWLSALVEQPAVAGLRKKAMIISVSGGGEMLSNTACRVTAKRLLVKKGTKELVRKALRSLKGTGGLKMTDFTAEELSEAHQALLSTLHKCEKMDLAKLGKSQQTLLVRRIAALKVALALIEKEQGQLRP